MIAEIIKSELPLIKKYIVFEVCYIVFDVFTLVMVNAVLGDIFPEETEFRNLLLFLTGLLLNVGLYMQAQKMSVRIVTGMIGKLRGRIMEKVQQAELESFERLGKSSIRNALSLDTQTIADVAHTFGWMGDAALLCIGLLTYQFLVCRPAFLFTAGVFSVGGLIYAAEILWAKKWIHRARDQEKELFDGLSHVIYGFKELKVNDRKSDDFFHQGLKPVSAANRSHRTRAENALALGNVLASVVECAAFVPVIFILPAFGDFSIHALVVSVVSLLFFPFNLIKDTIPYILRGWISVERIEELVAELEKLASERSMEPVREGPLRFRELCYEQICYAYRDREGNPSFSLDHIDFSIAPGEVVFITGGNGSGKSTLLKTITGLYAPVAGRVRLDGAEVTMARHRDLFAVIFADFHLFDRLYGLGDLDLDQVGELLKTMELDNKVVYKDKGFQPLTLSGGQRKRLALIAAMLEDKPIYIFDEWAADQAPQFRDYFYHVLLPGFKKAGKAVIAVTHDEGFFPSADRIYTMEYGRLKCG